MPATRPDIQSEDDIKLLVNTFYDKVNQDALLAPVFNEFAQIDWDRHLPIMYDFWSSILLGTSRYRGRPFQKHLPLPVDTTHFQRWIELFNATVKELFTGPKADEAQLRALNIATMFEYRLRRTDPLSLL